MCFQNYNAGSLLTRLHRHGVLIIMPSLEKKILELGAWIIRDSSLYNSLSRINGVVFQGYIRRTRVDLLR